MLVLSGIPFSSRHLPMPSLCVRLISPKNLERLHGVGLPQPSQHQKPGAQVLFSTHPLPWTKPPLSPGTALYIHERLCDVRPASHLKGSELRLQATEMPTVGAKGPTHYTTSEGQCRSTPEPQTAQVRKAISQCPPPLVPHRNSLELPGLRSGGAGSTQAKDRMQ